MSGLRKGFVNALGQQAGLLAPDVFEIGGRFAANADENKPKRLRRRRAGLAAPVIKQETAVTTDIVDSAALQVSMEQALQAYIDQFKTPEAKAEQLYKIGIYRQDLAKQAPLLANVDDDMADQVVKEWFGQGDADLKRLVWNAAAGSEEIPLAKRAEEPKGALALAKFLDEAPSEQVKMHRLQKIGAYSHQLANLREHGEGHPQDRQDLLIKTWVEAGDSELKKNILDAEMPAAGKAIYGTGVKADQVVHSVAGNASSHAGSKVGGSEQNSPDRIARSIPRAPKGEGSGSHMEGNLKMPGQNDGESPNPGSGPNDTGGGEVNPSVKIRRRGTTGGLGSVAGAEKGAAHSVSNKDTKVGQSAKEMAARKKAHQDGKKRWMGKSEDAADGETMDLEDLSSELVKIAPDDMIAALSELTPEDQVAVCREGAQHAADLMAWSDATGETLAKRDLDASVTEWLSTDPDSLMLKRWVAEALGTAEEIPLELAKAIMAWEPVGSKPIVRVRQPLAAAA